ncbi:hypothetical protein K450DRAFT_282260 [Umbelopsis ramanniana AG]|uniref:N-acetyltransferase domain-containing protein n=1 Tax=Umbelopsis ramanniana AG TaxID=1314678 RepID=A0AAD5HBB1_UMBRA|nr:uncharacterized protein K450DRAFT_282260 [Umbelopsis ramanniana AG]KAI8577802.1 hypothetical protein K450DRAFT_282260 [Umbelopsis ramanniana AG]
MSIDKTTRQWSSTDSAPDITVSNLEASEDGSAETLQIRGRPTTRNRSKLDKAKRTKSNPGTEEQDSLSNTITNRRTSSNTSKNAGNNIKEHNSTPIKIHTFVSHDEDNMMFKVDLDGNGCLAAICYLPTRFRGIIEFYHTEIPTEYRSAGVGDLLTASAFQWAEANGFLVLPTCPFIQRHLKQRFPNDEGRWTCIVRNEQEALDRIGNIHAKPSSSKDF